MLARVSAVLLVAVGIVAIVIGAWPEGVLLAVAGAVLLYRALRGRRDGS
jgi:hypothetical protein